MIKGLGTDIVNIGRIQEAIERHPDSFSERILTPVEKKDFDATKQQAAFLAKRFAVKEAAAKALGTGIAEGVSFQDFTITHDELGKPGLDVTGQAAVLAAKLSVKHWHLSISDEQSHAMATVIIES